ncbi:MAG: hypothetical protein PUC88_03770 [Clostridia bacterium]|nr:hypothetical protein [Clostridia bacterium]
MCYYIYGALCGDVNTNEYQIIKDKYEYKFHCGTKHNVKMSVQENSDSYRVTDWGCDCDSDLGKKDPNAEQVKVFEALFNDIKKLKGAEQIYLCKTWVGKRNKNEIKLKLDDVDIKSVLSELKVNCLYIFKV